MPACCGRLLMRTIFDLDAICSHGALCWQRNSPFVTHRVSSILRELPFARDIMDEEQQLEILSPVTDLGFVRILLADLHDELPSKVARFRQLADLSTSLGANGTMFTGGETTYLAWTEARSSFVHGNYIATVMLCQGLAEHLLASYLELGIDGEQLPPRVKFPITLERCLSRGIIVDADVKDLHRLMKLRNPLSHYRNIDDPSNLTHRALENQSPAADHVRGDASFALSVAVRLLSLPAFRVGK